jgi:phosphoribosylaminoimidazole-succinocarboxamide synthase
MSVPSTSDQRTVNNVMRHEYRVLSAEEKTQMRQVKDLGLQFHDMLSDLGSSRELSIAKTKLEEVVMWAVKHITR